METSAIFFTYKKTKIALQAKDLLRWPITIWFTSSFLCLTRWKFQMRMQQWTWNGRSSKQSEHGNWRMSRSKRRSFWKHKETKKKSTLLHWRTSVISKNAELESKLQKFKGRVVLRGDFVKDDSRANAVFTGQGSSASQMTAAEVMDVIARWPDCDGQAADAISAYTQGKLEDAPRLLRIPTSKCPDVRIRLPRHKCPTSWANIEDPVVPFERNLYGHPFARLLWEEQLEEKLYWNSDGKNTKRKPKVWMYVRSSNTTVIKRLFSVDDIRNVGKKQNMAPMWKKLLKKRWSWWAHIISWSCIFWDVLNVNAKRTKR